MTDARFTNNCAVSEIPILLNGHPERSLAGFSAKRSRRTCISFRSLTTKMGAPSIPRSFAGWVGSHLREPRTKKLKADG